MIVKYFQIPQINQSVKDGDAKMPKPAYPLHGIYAEMSDLVGYENAIKIFERYKGQQINFPVRLYDKAAVKEVIKEKYNGENTKELARQFNYSERWVKEIVK